MTTQTADLATEETAPVRSLPVRMGAELVGTFLLVGVILMVTTYGSIGASATALYVALGAGLTYAALVVALGPISGGHLNPVVSLASAITGRLAWIDLVPYVVAQVLGGIGAGALLRAALPSELGAALGLADSRALLSTAANGFGTHSPLSTASQGAVSFSTMQALLVEAFATALLVAVVLGVGRRRSPLGPLAIGGALAAGTLVASQATNAALNPARATSIAFFSEGWALSQLWLFWVAPLVGALVVSLVVLTFQAVPVEADEDDDWDDDEDEDDDETAAGDSVERETEPDEHVLVVPERRDDLAAEAGGTGSGTETEADQPADPDDDLADDLDDEPRAPKA